ncbi:hypothetical protein J7E92_11650, partial [Streptomyces sp. ISL-63]|uniref:hypothetical protein n=1 Tax=Streptomyces sp. ISL-63 TaxID=2819185 RepID=UPI001BE90F1E
FGTLRHAARLRGVRGTPLRGEVVPLAAIGLSTAAGLLALKAQQLQQVGRDHSVGVPGVHEWG